MAWSDAIAAVGSVIKTAMDRLWGTQTRAEASLERRATEAKEQTQAALDDRDLYGATAHRGQLRRVRDEARAKAP